eukprot:scaffold51478_cov28-Phaeocystis_antarctica.AAC.1
MYGPGRLHRPHYTLRRKVWAVSDMMGVLGRALQLTTDMERSAVNTLELVWIANARPCAVEVLPLLRWRSGELHASLPW